jgi:protein phosphatase inhibitor 2
MSALPPLEQDRDKSITWDEEAIAEHDKLRGTRMKIDEPDTPYERDEEMALENASDSAAGALAASNAEKNRAPLDFSSLSAKLEGLTDGNADAAAAGPGGEEGLAGDEASDWVAQREARRDAEKKEAFRKRRQEHYAMGGGGRGKKANPLLRKPMDEEDED